MLDRVYLCVTRLVESLSYGKISSSQRGCQGQSLEYPRRGGIRYETSVATDSIFNVCFNYHPSEKYLKAALGMR